MNTKEAIEFCKQRKDYAWSFLELDKIDEVISLLQQGEAYRKLCEMAKPNLANNIKQKYLKEVKQDYPISEE